MIFILLGLGGALDWGLFSSCWLAGTRPGGGCPKCQSDPLLQVACVWRKTQDLNGHLGPSGRTFFMSSCRQDSSYGHNEKQVGSPKKKENWWKLGNYRMRQSFLHLLNYSGICFLLWIAFVWLYTADCFPFDNYRGRGYKFGHKVKTGKICSVIFVTNPWPKGVKVWTQGNFF